MSYRMVQDDLFPHIGFKPCVTEGSLVFNSLRSRMRAGGASIQWCITGFSCFIRSWVIPWQKALEKIHHRCRSRWTNLYSSRATIAEGRPGWAPNNVNSCLDDFAISVPSRSSSFGVSAQKRPWPGAVVKTVLICTPNKMF